MTPTVAAILARCNGNMAAAYNYCSGIYYAYRHEEWAIEYWLLAAYFTGLPEFKLRPR